MVVKYVGFPFLEEEVDEIQGYFLTILAFFSLQLLVGSLFIEKKNLIIFLHLEHHHSLLH